jgi:GntR family transcriptional regulator
LRQLHRTYVPLSVPAEALRRNPEREDDPPPPPPALFAWLESLGHTDLTWSEYVRTRMPLPDEVTSLRLAEGVPVLHVLRVTLSADGIPLALEELRLPGDDLEIVYTYRSTTSS